jgi:hypothetical protein
MAIRKVGRDAISGRFVSRRTTRRFPATTTVETVEVPRRSRLVSRAARPQMEDTEMERPLKAANVKRSK